MKTIHANCVTTEDSLEVTQKIHRGFAIKEFVSVTKSFEVDECYCPDPDDGGRIPGKWELRVQRLYRAIRIKTGQDIWQVRGYSIEQVVEQIDQNLGEVRDPIPF